MNQSKNELGIELFNAVANLSDLVIKKTEIDGFIENIKNEMTMPAAVIAMQAVRYDMSPMIKNPLHSIWIQEILNDVRFEIKEEKSRIFNEHLSESCKKAFLSRHGETLCQNKEDVGF